ncbi:MAG: hypothetical protein CL534_13740, partial [Ahrensia sp.]|nr:hypothetical protein [Ahrensia sp.]
LLEYRLRLLKRANKAPAPVAYGGEFLPVGSQLELLSPRTGDVTQRRVRNMCRGDQRALRLSSLAPPLGALKPNGSLVAAAPSGTAQRAWGVADGSTLAGPKLRREVTSSVSQAVLAPREGFALTQPRLRGSASAGVLGRQGLAAAAMLSKTAGANVGGRLKLGGLRAAKKSLRRKQRQGALPEFQPIPVPKKKKKRLGKKARARRRRARALRRPTPLTKALIKAATLGTSRSATALVAPGGDGNPSRRHPRHLVGGDDVVLRAWSPSGVRPHAASRRSVDASSATATGHRGRRLDMMGSAGEGGGATGTLGLPHVRPTTG